MWRLVRGVAPKKGKYEIPPSDREVFVELLWLVNKRTETGLDQCCYAVVSIA